VLRPCLDCGRLSSASRCAVHARRGSDSRPSAYLRGYDQKTGQEVGAVWMPAPQSGSPMTYSYDGKQYIIVAVSGGNYSGDYLAFSLPGGQ
jgi:quinoprotein glucose dehydrogenase